MITKTYCHSCANTLSASSTAFKQSQEAQVLSAPCRGRHCGHCGDLAVRELRAPKRRAGLEPVSAQSQLHSSDL